MIAKLVVEQVFVDNCVEDVAHAKYDHFVVSGSYVFDIPSNPKVNGKWGGAFVQQRSHWVLGLHMAVSSLDEFGSRIP